MMHVKEIITKDRLIRDLRDIGLCEGDMVYVHTSMKSIGWIDGGAETLIDAFLCVLGEGGTLAVPTHTLSFVGRGVRPYNPKTTPTILGTFPEAVWRHQSSLRSQHASHSSAAIGAKAEFLTNRHNPAHALDYDSPLHRLYRSHGKVLLLVVANTSNTSLHLAESLANSGYTRLPYDASWGSSTHRVLEDGTVQTDEQIGYPGCSGSFQLMNSFFKYNDISRFGRIGNAQSQLLMAHKMVDLTVDVLQHKHDFLLCDNENCPSCPPRKEYLRKHVK